MKYQIRLVSRKTGALNIKRPYRTEADAERELRNAGFEPVSTLPRVWVHPNWFAKIWVDEL